MVETLYQSVDEPASWPAKPSGLSTAADALSEAFVWRRLEGRMSWRWGERSAVWTVQGPGEFDPPLKPATITATEVWDGTGWTSRTLEASPLGGVTLTGAGPWRITATVGESEAPPDIVLEAYRRFAEYLAELGVEAVPTGAQSHSIDLGGVKESVRLDPHREARALDLSGAADLLREYRRP